MPELNLTREFASVLHAWKPAGAELETIARLLLIDGLAVAVAGSVEPGPRRAGAMVRQSGGAPVATVIGQGFCTASPQAALLNGMSMHVLDYEPMWSPPNHALSTILPSLLALGEMREAQGGPAQGAAVLAALLKGVEAQGRLRLSSGQLEPKELSLHPPGAVGPIAAAAACGDMLGFDVPQLVAAMGIAASRCAGVLANVGSMTKALHCGDSCRNGLEAALLAGDGFTANADALGGPRGYGNSYFGERFDASVLTAPLLVPRVLKPGPAWKLFPSQYATHFAIRAAADCHAAIPDTRAIRAVEVVTPVMPYIDRPKPVSGLDGKFSYQYCAAAALLDGQVTRATFSDQRRFAPEMEALLERIVLRQDASVSGRFDAMHVDVKVTLADGGKIERRCSAPPGSWSQPVAPSVIEAKAHDLLDDALGPKRADAFWSEIAKPVPDLRISNLMRVLAEPVHGEITG
jgi:aconitate decarboxylase